MFTVISNICNGINASYFFGSVKPSVKCEYLVTIPIQDQRVLYLRFVSNPICSVCNRHIMHIGRYRFLAFIMNIIPFFQNGSIEIKRETFIKFLRHNLSLSIFVTVEKVDIVDVRISLRLSKRNIEHTIAGRGVIQAVIRQEITANPITLIFFVITRNKGAPQIQSRGRHTVIGRNLFSVREKIIFTSHALTVAFNHYGIRRCIIQNHGHLIYIECNGKIIILAMEGDPFTLVQIIDTSVFRICRTDVIFASIRRIVVVRPGIGKICINLISSVIVCYAVSKGRAVCGAQIKDRILITSFERIVFISFPNNIKYNFARTCFARDSVGKYLKLNLSDKL